MTANTSPIFIGTPNSGFIESVTAANTATDGTGTVGTIFTAGANGSYVKGIRIKALGTNVATVARFFLNNGSATTTAANNVLIGEYALTTSTASNSAVISPDYYYPLNMIIAAGYKITVTLGTAVSAGHAFMTEGGDF